jgi:class 3 adenylate cyclase/predicted ATPase
VRIWRNVPGDREPARFRFLGPRCTIRRLNSVPRGVRTTSAASGPRDTTPPREEGSAERRQLTVLFCDVVASTELADKLDPEDLRDVVLDYQSTCAAVIAAYDGHIAQYLGDGLLVYFGYPAAHEDDARRAVRSGLGIVEAIERGNERIEAERGVRLAVRVGIHTGMVVAGEMGAGARREDLAVGRTPNIAARLQALADPNAVLISAATQHLVAGYFELEPLGPRELKGISEPVEVYRAIHESAARSRLEAAPAGGLTELVGREEDRRILLEAWSRTVAGSGQVVFIAGEAGIGKSRLVRMLEEHVASEPSAWLTPCQGSPYHGATALYPFIELFERFILRFDRGDTPAERAEKLDGWLAQYGFDRETTAPLFTALLGLPADLRYPPLSVTPERQKQLTIETLVSAVVQRAETQPVLFVFEDAQWADPTTLDLLGALLDRAAANRLMAVITYRDDARPAIADREGATELTLERLAPEESAAVIERVAGGMRLPDEVERQIVDRTDGVPLFVEELTKNLLESGLLANADGRWELVTPLPPMAVPATLHDSLMARLDRLGPAKPMAQLGSVIGREFELELLRAVAPWDEAAIRDRLDALVEAELLVAAGDADGERFIFKHALIQEAAYQSLLRSTRNEHHERVARALVEEFADTTAGRPEMVAYHYTRAGQAAASIPHWVAAGQAAMGRSANLDAVSHLTTALEQLATLPESPQRDGQELGLRVLTAVPMTLTRGWANPEVGEMYERAAELTETVGEVPELFPTRVGVLTYYLVRGQLATAYDLAVRDLELADRFGNVDFQIEAELDRGTTSYYLGNAVESRTHLERAAALYEAPRHHPHVFMYGKDPGAVAMVHLSGVQWLMGEPDRGLGTANAARALSETWFHPFSALWTGVGQAFSHQVRGDAPAVAKVADWIVSESVEQVFPNWLAQGQVFLGWALSAMGQTDRGVEMMRGGLALWEMTGAELFRTYLLSLLADGLRTGGDAKEALEVVESALALAERTDERFWEAELRRVHGDLMLETGADDAAADAEYATALELARSRSQPSLELRAATSRARLLRAGGDGAGAAALLRPILAQFPEQAETRDIAAGHAMLAGAEIPDPARR